MSTMHYFAGGNTAQGFFSCFEDMVQEKQRKRMFYIKGGPGVGKSSLMKKIGLAAEKAGWEVEYFHCSSDPESLDGVAFPEKGVALMDGTSPHVYDPAVPGARDTLVSLGDYLDEKQLRPALEDVRRIQGEISRRFGRCYQYLAAAEKILAAAPQGTENQEKARNLAAEWIEALPLRGGIGRRRSFLGRAFTPKGLVEVTMFPANTRHFLVECPFGAWADDLMSRLDQAMGDRGLDRIALLDPLSPGHMEKLWLPAHGLVFGCVAKDASPSAVKAERLFDLSPGEEYSFDRNAYELLCQRALEQLVQAKSLHDELEAPYIRSMDFGRLGEKKKELFSLLGLEE